MSLFEFTESDRAELLRMDRAFDEAADHNKQLVDQNIGLVNSCQNWVKDSRRNFRGMLLASSMAGFWWLVAMFWFVMWLKKG